MPFFSHDSSFVDENNMSAFKRFFKFEPEHTFTKYALNLRPVICL